MSLYSYNKQAATIKHALICWCTPLPLPLQLSQHSMNTWSEPDAIRVSNTVIWVLQKLHDTWLMCDFTANPLCICKSIYRTEFQCSTKSWPLIWVYMNHMICDRSGELLCHMLSRYMEIFSDCLFDRVIVIHCAEPILWNRVPGYNINSGVKKLNAPFSIMQ